MRQTGPFHVPWDLGSQHTQALRVPLALLGRYILIHDIAHFYGSSSCHQADQHTPASESLSGHDYKRALGDGTPVPLCSLCETVLRRGEVPTRLQHLEGKASC